MLIRLFFIFSFSNMAFGFSKMNAVGVVVQEKTYSTCLATNDTSESDSLRKGITVGVYSIFFKKRTYSKTLYLGGTIRKNSNKNWLSYYASGNYFEFSTLTSFGGLFSSLGLEIGASFNLLQGRRVSSSIYAGLGYHRVTLFDYNQILRQNACAVFTSFDVNYVLKKYEFGVIVGYSIGRGPAVTFVGASQTNREVLFSAMPKLGIQIKYNL